MSKIEEFFNAVSHELTPAILRGSSFQIIDNCLNIEKNMPSPAPYMSIHSKLLHVTVDPYAKHRVVIVEVWVGRDGEGALWSDNMGGRYIDCTGKKFKEAAKFVADQIDEFYGEMLNG